MGSISIIARRLGNTHVQYGWSGNGGYFRLVGIRLLAWYQDPKDVEYLFDLGQTALIGQVGSENGGFGMMETHQPTGTPFWVGTSEREIFTQIAFIDYGYFYDTDNRWYYVIPDPFRIKISLELIKNHLNGFGYEFDYLKEVEGKILHYIFIEYPQSDFDFANLLSDENYGEETLDGLLQSQFPMHEFWEKYAKLFRYFDDWILVETNSDDTEITNFVLRKKEEQHTETCYWIEHKSDVENSIDKVLAEKDEIIAELKRQLAEK